MKQRRVFLKVWRGPILQQGPRRPPAPNKKGRKMASNRNPQLPTLRNPPSKLPQTTPSSPSEQTPKLSAVGQKTSCLFPLLGCLERSLWAIRGTPKTRGCPLLGEETNRFRYSPILRQALVATDSLLGLEGRLNLVWVPYATPPPINGLFLASRRAIPRTCPAKHPPALTLLFPNADA